METEAATGLMQAVETYGLAAMVVMESVAIVWMWKYIKDLHAQRTKDAKEAAERQRAEAENQREDMKATVTALVEVRDALRSFKEAMEAVAQKLGSS